MGFSVEAGEVASNMLAAAVAVVVAAVGAVAVVVAVAWRVGVAGANRNVAKAAPVSAPATDAAT